MHKKAASAAADTAESGAKNASSGIDYLRLVETRHRGTMTADPISFVKASTSKRPAVVFVPTVAEAACRVSTPRNRLIRKPLARDIPQPITWRECTSMTVAKYSHPPKPSGR